jgi:Domain of unknown function DUF11
MISRAWTCGVAVASLVGLLLAVGAADARTRAAVAAPLCAFRESTVRDGDIATATFHVVADGCQISFVSISKFADGNAIFDTATGTFDASDTRATLTVHLPCGVTSETDLVLGPPTLYPPDDLDLGATAFDVACPSGGGGGGGGGGGSGASGPSGASGGGTTTSLPDLATTVTTSKTKGLRLGDPVHTTISVTNKGKIGAGGVHVLISLSPNIIPKGAAQSSRGPGCTGVSVLDCNLGSLQSGATTTVTMVLSAASGRKMFIAAQAKELETDATPTDNVGTLTLAILPRAIPFTLSSVPGHILAGEQLVYIKLSARARVSAQLYRGRVALPIVWHRNLGAGTTLVRIPLNGVVHGQHFTLVLRAKTGAKTATTRLSLKR